MLKKLRIKFVCIMMVMVTVLMSVILGLVIHFTGQNLEKENIELMQRVLSEPGLPEPYGGSSITPYFTISRDIMGKLRVSDSRFLGDYDEQTLLEIWEAARVSGLQTGKLEEYDLCFLKGNSLWEERIVFLDISAMKMTMNSLIRVSVSVGILSLVLFLGLSILLARWSVKPVEKAWEQQRQFVADASHELKTPLTVIMTNAELLQNSDFDEPSRREFSERILTMSRQMRGLVAGLLELARADNGTVKINFVQVDLSELMADAILPFEPLYFEKELTLTSDIETGIRLRGSAPHLRQVMEILLDNAMKYSAPKGGANVLLKKQRSHCLLCVSSPGEEISDADLKNIFKRFYRINKARTRDGSYGLGLSIAQSIVEDHRGKIWAESSGGVNSFFVQLPL